MKEKDYCPMCGEEELVEYITTQGKYCCCDNCGFEHPEVNKYE